MSATLDRLAELPLASVNSVALFGHGQFMQAVRWCITSPQLVIDTRSMHAFYSFDLTYPIANTGGFLATCDARIWTVDLPLPLPG